MDAIVSVTPDLVYAFDLEHRFIFVNNALLVMWGKSWDESIGKTCLELGYEPSHAAMHDREIEHVVATGEPVRGEVPFEGTHGLRIYDYIFVPVFNDSGVVEAVAGTTRDVTDRKNQERHRDMLADELQHRVKNTMAVIQAIARQSFGSGPAYNDFSTRLRAMASGLDILTREHWAAGDLRQIIESALSTHLRANEEQFRIGGAQILVKPRSVIALSLAISELGTNAVKYGALSLPTGTIFVSWSVEDGRFRLLWREEGGPLVAEPVTSGFGTLLISNLASELGGTINLKYLPGGVSCEFDAPLSSIFQDEAERYDARACLDGRGPNQV